MFSPFSTSQRVGTGAFVSTPLACGPRNCGQLPAGKLIAATSPKSSEVALLRSLQDTWRSIAVERPFPLTLTLSLREREQQASDWCLADGRWANSGTGVIERRWTILPLPRERAGVRGKRM